MADTCRCHLPLDPPIGPCWLPWRDREPGPDVRAVAILGQDPLRYRRVRVSGGWHGEGLCANHPDATPPVPWARAGLCWAGTEHPVVDVTSELPTPPAPPAPRAPR